MNKAQLNTKLLLSNLPCNAVVAIGELDAKESDVFEFSENCIIPENFENEFFCYEAVIENEFVINLVLIEKAETQS